MAFVRMTFLILLLIAAFLFATENLDTVVVNNPFNDNFYPFPLAVVVLASIAIGVILWGVVSFFASLGLRGEIRRLQRANRELKDELTRLRNLSVLEDHELFAGPEDSDGDSGTRGLVPQPREGGR